MQLAVVIAAFLGVLTCPSARPAIPGQSAPPKKSPAQNERHATARVRNLCPVRLGGMFLPNAPGHISAQEQVWLSANCDVAALPYSSAGDDTFRTIVKAEPVFTPLLALSAQRLPQTSSGAPAVAQEGPSLPDVRPPSGALRREWDSRWTGEATLLLRKSGAFGLVVTDIPHDLSSAGGTTVAVDSNGAVAPWLTRMGKGRSVLLVPESTGFDMPAAHGTLPIEGSNGRPALVGRVWDAVYGASDGVWCPDWLRRLGDPRPLPESIWEAHLEAADRAAAAGQVFIATAAYRNDAELEFALASYLLVAHRQGRFVLQPVPDGGASPANLSVAGVMAAVSAREGWFNVPLGAAEQDRHVVPVEGGSAWRRGYEKGVVYANGDSEKTVTVAFGGRMVRLDGSAVTQVILPPRHGVVVLYPAGK